MNGGREREIRMEKEKDKKEKGKMREVGEIRGKEKRERLNTGVRQGETRGKGKGRKEGGKK